MAVEETVDEEYDRLGIMDDRGKGRFASRPISQGLTSDFTDESVTLDVVLAAEHVEERDTDLISGSRPFIRVFSGPADASVASEREDETENAESPLTVLSIGGRVRGRVSVVGVCFVLGRRGVCNA